MKYWIQTHRRSAILVGLTFLLPAYLFLNVLGAALSARADYRDQIESIEPRLARLQGLIEKESDIRVSLEGISTIVTDNIYAKSTAAAGVAASLQAEARRVLSDAGMEVTNSQVLPPRKRNAFDYVSVKVVARGTLEQLDEGLAEFGRFRPVVFIESLDAFPNRRRRRDEAETQTLTVSIQLLTLRSAS
jgi:general secretion pathway protein M